MTYNYNHGTNGYSWSVEVRAEAHLDYWIKDYFENIAVIHEDNGITQLTGVLQDLPAVYGFILQLRDTGVTLLSLQIERNI